MRQVVETGKPILVDLLTNKAGTFVVSRIPLRDESGEVIGALGMVLFDHPETTLQPLIAKFAKLQRELDEARKELAAQRRPKYTFASYVGSSPAALEVKRQARRAAQLDTTVLLLGETGAGKEMLAHAIHAASSRALKPFIGVNLAAVPETLLEAEFFGVAPGAYTGADRKGRDGKFRVADGGTLFLDEIGDVPLPLQVKLLRFLQERVIERIGGRQPIAVDTRIVSATHQDLEAMIVAGSFREDLYYRLAEIVVAIPSLAERPGDAVLLARHFTNRFARELNPQVGGLAPDALDAIEAYGWPGNVRELENRVKRAVIMADGKMIGAHDLDLHGKNGSDGEAAPINLRAAREVADRRAIHQALTRSENNISNAAKLLGISRPTLYDLMKQYQLGG